MGVEQFKPIFGQFLDEWLQVDEKDQFVNVFDWTVCHAWLHVHCDGGVPTACHRVVLHVCLKILVFLSHN